MQRYTIFFIAANALHVSGGFSAHHQELKTVHTASGICQGCLLLPLSWVSWQLLYMFQAVFPPIIRTSNCTHSIWYMSSLLAATASVGELAVALHVSGGFSAHHLELKLYTQHLICQACLLLPLAWQCQLTHASGSSKQAWRISDAVCTVWAPDDGRKNHLKHVEQLQTHPR
jgi:hypothetical protein